MTRRAAVALASLLALNLPGLSTGQEDSGCLRRRVVVNVSDDERRFITGLQPEDFLAEMGGRPVRIGSAKPFTATRNIVVLVDSSGSMGSNSPFPAERHEASLLLASEIVKTARPVDRIRVVFFADSVAGGVAFAARDRANIELRIRQAASPAKGRTAILDAVLKQMASTDAPQIPVTDVVLLTDMGGDNRSKVTLSAVKSTLVRGGVRFFPVLMRLGGFPATPDEKAGPRDMSDLAEHTGGLSLWSKSFDQGPLRGQAIEGVAQALVTWWMSAYELNLELPSSIEKPSSWKLRIVDRGGKKRRRIAVSYPRKLFPCGQPPG